MQKTAKASLQKYNQKTTHSNKIFVLKRIWKPSMANRMMEKHEPKLLNLLNKLMVLGTVLKNNFLAVIFLKSLPEYYSYITLIWFSSVHFCHNKFRQRDMNAIKKFELKNCGIRGNSQTRIKRRWDDYSSKLQFYI